MLIERSELTSGSTSSSSSGRERAGDPFDESALYDAAHHHLLHPRKKRRATGWTRGGNRATRETERGKRPGRGSRQMRTAV